MAFGLGLGLPFTPSSGGGGGGGAFSFTFAPEPTAALGTNYTRSVSLTGLSGSQTVTADVGMTFKIGAETIYSDTPRACTAADGSVVFAVCSSYAGSIADSYSASIGAVTATAPFVVTTVATSFSTPVDETYAAKTPGAFLTDDALWVAADGMTPAANPTFDATGGVYFPAYGLFCNTAAVRTTVGFAVTADIEYKSHIASDRVVLCANSRLNTLNNCYYAGIERVDSTHYRWTIRNLINTSQTDGALFTGSSIADDAVGTIYRVEFIGMGSSSGGVYGAVGMALCLMVSKSTDGGATFGAASMVGSAVETSKMFTSGKFGLGRTAGTAQTATTGYHIKGFKMSDRVVDPPAIVLSGGTQLDTVAPSATVTPRTWTVPAGAPVVISCTGARYKIAAGALQSYPTYAFPGQVVTFDPETATAVSAAQLDIICAANQTSTIWRLKTTGTANTAPHLFGGTGLRDAATNGTYVYTVAAAHDYTMSRREICTPLVPWEGFGLTYGSWAGVTSGAGAAEVACDPSTVLAIRIHYGGKWYDMDFGGRGSMPYVVASGKTEATATLPIAGPGTGEKIVVETYTYAPAGSHPAWWHVADPLFTGGTAMIESMIFSASGHRIAVGTQPTTTTDAGFTHTALANDRGYAPFSATFQGLTKSVVIACADSVGDGKDEVDGNYNVGAGGTARRIGGYIQHGLDSAVGGHAGFHNSAVSSSIISTITGIGSGQGWFYRHGMATANLTRHGNLPMTHLWVEGGLNEPGYGVSGYVKTCVTFLTAAYSLPVIVSSAMIRTEGNLATNSAQDYYGASKPEPTSWAAPTDVGPTIRDYFALEVDGSVTWRFVDVQPWYSGYGLPAGFQTGGEVADPNVLGFFGPYNQWLTADLAYAPGGVQAVGVAPGGLHPGPKQYQFVGHYAVALDKTRLLA